LICSFQPRRPEVFRRPGTFRRKNGLDPVGKGFRWSELSGQLGVIKVAMGIHQTREQNNFAEVGKGTRVGRANIFPAADCGDAVSGNGNRAVLNGRRGYGNHDAGSQEHGLLGLRAGLFLQARGDLVLLRLGLAVLLAELLFQLLGGRVNRRVEIGVLVFRE